jgi:hypothetical protein
MAIGTVDPMTSHTNSAEGRAVLVDVVVGAEG